MQCTVRRACPARPSPASSAVPPMHLISSVMPLGAPYVAPSVSQQHNHCTRLYSASHRVSRECRCPHDLPAAAGLASREHHAASAEQRALLATRPGECGRQRDRAAAALQGPLPGRPHLPRRLIVAVPAGCRLCSAPRVSVPADSPPDRCPAQRCRPSRAAGAPAVAGACILTGFGSCGRAIPGTLRPRRSDPQVAAALLEEQVTTQLY